MPNRPQHVANHCHGAAVTLIVYQSDASHIKRYNAWCNMRDLKHGNTIRLTYGDLRCRANRTQLPAAKQLLCRLALHFLSRHPWTSLYDNFSAPTCLSGSHGHDQRSLRQILLMIGTVPAKSQAHDHLKATVGLGLLAPQEHLSSADLFSVTLSHEHRLGPTAFPESMLPTHLSKL